MKQILALTLALLMILSLAACAIPLPAGTAAGNRTAAPDFTVYDAQGQAFRLSDFRGKPVVLNFWASWCGPCKSEMPDFQKKYDAYGQQIHFLFINLTDGQRETVQTASDFIQGRGYTFPVYYDTDYAAANAYGIRSIPTTVFIDAEGFIVAQATGMLSSSQLQQGIDKILK